MPPRDDTLLFGHLVRMTKAQRNFIAARVQANDTSLSAEIRRCIDAEIDRQAPVDGMEVNGEPATVRYVLESFDADPEELAEILSRAGLHEDAE